MTTDRHILHIDMDAFFAAVEQRDHPELRGKPIVVGHDGPRGVVTTASYEARKFGCHSAQPVAVAKRQCPGLIVVPTRHRHYVEISKKVFAIFGEFTPIVQPLSVDEAFLDVTGSIRAFGAPEVIAQSIRARIQDTLQLSASVGVAPTMFLAKLASSLDKPDGLTVVPRDRVQEWLDPQPIRRMWGVGPKTGERLDQIGVRTFADLRRLPESLVESMLGRSGNHIHRLARGLDPRRVTNDAAARQISHEQTFGTNLDDPDAVRRILLRQTEDVAARVRRHGHLAAGVTLKIRSGDFETITRSQVADQPTAETDHIWELVATVFDDWVRSSWRPVRLIGVSARVAAEGAGCQTMLFGQTERERCATVDRVSDAINERFGHGQLRRAGALKPPSDSSRESNSQATTKTSAETSAEQS